MSARHSSASPGPLMSGPSSRPSTTQLRTVSNAGSQDSSSESELSSLSDEQARLLGAELLAQAKKSAPSGTGQRKRSRGGAKTEGSRAVKKAKKDVNGTESTKDPYCHHCRQKRDSKNVLRCSRLRQPNGNRQNGPLRRCYIPFCDNDLEKRYGVHAQAVRAHGRSGFDDEELSKHDPDSQYVFTCPCCQETCSCLPCRRKRGLELMDAPAKSTPQTSQTALPTLSKSESIRPLAANPPQPLLHQKDSSAFDVIHEDSDLSSLTESDTASRERPGLEDEIRIVKKPRPPNKVGKHPAKSRPSGASSGKPTATVKHVRPKTGELNKKKKVNGKEANDAKKKGKPRGETEAKRKSAAEDGSARKKESKPEIIIDPPAFEKVDTSLGRVEAEQRIMLREFLLRFRVALAIPERSLPPLDDFDRSLTEASVRLFAGSILEVIKHELEGSTGADQELLDTMFKHREELRYYADLARFAAIYNSLSSPLSLKMPSAVVTIPRRLGADANAIRAVLDLEDGQAVPDWLQEAGPSRRTGASRIPQPAEVVRMLLALAERALATPEIRADLESTSGESEERRRYSSKMKTQTSAWEAKKLKLAEARVRCKTAAETRANKQEFTREHLEHEMRVALLNVNMRAQQARRAPRHEPLGVDFEGRTYYALALRPVEDDGRPPIGWASGLLVWGVGVPGKPGVAIEDDLPVHVERWSHFGKSAAVKQLIKWLDWRLKKTLTSMKMSRTPVKAKSTVSTPVKATASPSKITDFLKPTAKKLQKSRQRFEIVMPSRGAQRSKVSLSIDGSTDTEEASSISSGLTPPPVPIAEDIRETLAPAGYEPSRESVEEEGKELLRRLKEVAEWLEVLEWKGMGEVH